MDMIKIPFADMTTHSHNGVETPVVETGGNIEAEESFLSFVYDREKSGHANSDGPSVKNTPTQAADVPNATDVVQTPAQFLILEVDVQNRLETTVISKALPDQLGHLEPDALISKPAGQLDSDSTPLAETNLSKRVKSQREVPPDSHISEREYTNNLTVEMAFKTDQIPHEELVLGTLQHPFSNNTTNKPMSEVAVSALPANADKVAFLAGNLQFLTSRIMSDSTSEKGGDLAHLNTEASYYLFKDGPGQAIQRQEVGKNAVQSNQHNPLPPKITKATLQNENNNITAKMQKSNQETGFAVEKGADKLNPVLPDRKNTSHIELPKSKPRDL
ncbi:MAG TPA: hypothetical protein DD729_04825, partial [Rhodobacteraceae bacterium]|nr:hypothetical protein [Paracoccaceae bacterium]